MEDRTMNTTIATEHIREGSTSTGSCRLDDIVDGIRYLAEFDQELADLIYEFGNVTGDDAVDYARRVWDKNVAESDVWLCEITPSYYREIADSIPNDTVRYG